MKAGGRFRFFVTLLAILASTAAVGLLVYETIFDTLRRSYQQMLDRSVDQGVFLVDSYLQNQFTLLSLYASVPTVQDGGFATLPEWLKNPGSDRVSPKRLGIIDAHGRGIASTGQTFSVPDRAYFRLALNGQKNVDGPIQSRIDGQPIVVVAVPVPGSHPKAAVLTASISLTVIRNLLHSVEGVSGAELTLTTINQQVLATTYGLAHSQDGELLESAHSLTTAPWTLAARVRLADFMQPVRAVMFAVGLLIVAGSTLIIGFFLTGLRHRHALDQAREDRTQALRDAYEQIRKLAFHDMVTDLPNRNLVIRKIAEALQGKAPKVVIVIDLARFRNLTTTFGMHFGDSVLREAALRLVRLLPQDQGGFVGRIAGSEFILLVDEARYSPPLLKEIVALFHTPIGQDDLKLHVGVHLGVCRLLEAGQTPEEVIKSAETALWAARELGPNEVSELTFGAVEQRARRAQLQKRLPEALSRGEFEVHYQPQVDLKSGFVAGYEALLRWSSPDLGPVGPSEFIPVAEETGFIVPLGYWVLDQGIEFAQALRRAGSDAVVSVNVSAVQFLHHAFLDEVSVRIERAGLPPRSLGLEITESTLMEGIDQLGPALTRIMDSGVKVSLDDFGTGYSSLNYLKQLPIHVLKIDKSFIDALDTDQRAYHLIECIIQLAHHLGLVVVAEGIETLRQQDLLTRVNCDLVQGFHTGRPRPAQEHLTELTR